MMFGQILIVGVFPEHLSELQMSPGLAKRIDGPKTQNGLQTTKGAANVRGVNRQKGVAQAQQGHVTEKNDKILVKIANKNQVSPTQLELNPL